MACVALATLHLSRCVDCEPVDCAVCIRDLEGGSGSLIAGRLAPAPESMTSAACRLEDLSLIVPWSFRADAVSGTFMFGQTSRQATFLLDARGALTTGDGDARDAIAQCDVAALQR